MIGYIDATVMLNGEDIECNVEYEYAPGEAANFPYSPGTEDEVSICVVTDEDGNDITSQIRSVDEERIISRIINKEQD